jgi:hypothetical protein
MTAYKQSIRVIYPGDKAVVLHVRRNLSDDEHHLVRSLAKQLHNRGEKSALKVLHDK